MKLSSIRKLKKGSHDTPNGVEFKAGIRGKKAQNFAILRCNSSNICGRFHHSWCNLLRLPKNLRERAITTTPKCANLGTVRESF
jgi:hypothetical protein